MSIVSDNAIEIVATMDTTGVSSGVERINQSLKGIRWDIAEASGINPRQAMDAGESFGESFVGGMASRILGSMLIRDAIRGILYTAQEAVSEFLGNDERMSGGIVGKGFHPLKAIGDSLGDLATIIEHHILSVSMADQARAASIVRSQSAKAESDTELQNLRDHPEQIAKTSVLQEGLKSLIDQRSGAAGKYANYQSDMLRIGSPEDPDVEAEFKRSDKALAERERLARELVSIGKERDRAQAEADKKSYGTGYRDRPEEKAQEFMRGRIREEEHEAQVKAERDAKEAALKAARQAKRKEELDLTNQEHDLGKSQGALDRDLDYTEKSIRAVKATSAVMINGGLYGRNDSAVAMVQHAAQSVSLLRSIDNNIREIRAKHTELTLSNP